MPFSMLSSSIMNIAASTNAFIHNLRRAAQFSPFEEAYTSEAARITRVARSRPCVDVSPYFDGDLSGRTIKRSFSAATASFGEA